MTLIQNEINYKTQPIYINTLTKVKWGDWIRLKCDWI